MLPLVHVAILQTQANVPAPLPPKLSSAWTALKEVPNDAAEYALIPPPDVNLSRLWAFKAGGPAPIRFGDISGLDCVPDGGAPPGIAVYERNNQWCLVHSSESGWYWVNLREEELKGVNESPFDDPSKVIYPALEYPKVTEQILATSPDGWITFSSLAIIYPLENEQLRSGPDLKLKAQGLVEGEYLRILERSGDWVRVQEPLKIEMVPAGGDKVDYPKIKWNPKRVGWIRWRIPGPVPGSSIKRLRGCANFGIID